MIPQGHRFACLTFRFYHPRPQLDNPIDLGHGFLAYPKFPVQLDTFWREALGSIETEQIENASFTLVASEEVADVYNVNDLCNLQSRVQFLHWALVLVAGISSYDYCVLLSGGNGNEGLKVKQRSHLKRVYRMDGISTQPASIANLYTAEAIAIGIEQLNQARNPSDDYWRMGSGLDAFITGIRSKRPHVRLHQFVRAIETFVPPEAKGAEKFTEHVKTFLSQTVPAGEPDPSVILKQMYTLRNASEHHRDFMHGLPTVPATEREKIAISRLQQAETLCRALYRRLLMLDDSHRKYWASEDSIRTFWSKTESERRQIWGEQHDLVVAT